MNLVFRAPCASFPYRDPVLVQMAFRRGGEGSLINSTIIESSLYAWHRFRC